MNESLITRLSAELEEIQQAGLFKRERIIESPQGPVIQVGGKEVLNLCANNYLVLSSHPKIIEAAKKAKGDVIVMASNKNTGLKGILLGSETHAVIVHSALPVLVLG